MVNGYFFPHPSGHDFESGEKWEVSLGATPTAGPVPPAENLAEHILKRMGGDGVIWGVPVDLDHTN